MEQIKNEVRKSLKSLVERLGSQRRAANQLQVGTTTVGDIIRGDKDEQISETMWRKLHTQLTHRSSDWISVETNAYKEITSVLEDACKHSNCTWIIADAGAGKSTTARLYATEHKEAIYVLCSEDMRRRDFIDSCLIAIGERTTAVSLRGRLEALIGYLRDRQHPVLILDEADKLIDSILLYCVTIYNHLEGHCGIVLMSTDYGEKRMRSGLRCNKRGYNELHSRIGRRFYAVDRTSPRDVYGICHANGVTDSSMIDEIIKDAEQYEFDLRRVRKAVMKRRI